MYTHILEPYLIQSTIYRVGVSRVAKQKLSINFVNPNVHVYMLSVDGVLGHEARMFLNRLGDNIADMWKKSRSEVMGWVRAKMSFAILRATNLCLHGSRIK